MEKVLGKITKAEFGTNKSFPFLMGLHLLFSLDGGSTGIGDGGQYTVNISPECQWSKEERSDALVSLLEKVDGILEEAKVNYVSELVNRPVEVFLENNTFKDFRILTEVL